MQVGSGCRIPAAEEQKSRQNLAAFCAPGFAAQWVFLVLVCSESVPIIPQYVHLVVSSGGKYNHILATI
jgi:hypothetical protein